jgi:hypothetical protein
MNEVANKICPLDFFFINAIRELYRSAYGYILAAVIMHLGLVILRGTGRWAAHETAPVVVVVVTTSVRQIAGMDHGRSERCSL